MKTEREQILGAIARGWCTPANANKVMDERLAVAIADEIEAHINRKWKTLVCRMGVALRLSQEYAGETLPNLQGWSHYDARVQAWAAIEAPDVPVAEMFP